MAAQRHEEALGIYRALHDGRIRARYRECLSSVREQGDPLCAVELLQGLARQALVKGELLC